MDFLGGGAMAMGEFVGFAVAVKMEPECLLIFSGGSY